MMRARRATRSSLNGLAQTADADDQQEQRGCRDAPTPLNEAARPNLQSAIFSLQFHNQMSTDRQCKSDNRVIG